MQSYECPKSYRSQGKNKTCEENGTSNRLHVGALTGKCEFEHVHRRLGLDNVHGILEDVRALLLQEVHSLDLEINSCVPSMRRMATEEVVNINAVAMNRRSHRSVYWYNLYRQIPVPMHVLY